MDSRQTSLDCRRWRKLGTKLLYNSFRFSENAMIGRLQGQSRVGGVSAMSIDNLGALVAVGSRSGLLRIFDIDEYLIKSMLSPKTNIEPVLIHDTRNDISKIAWSPVQADTIAVSFAFSQDILLFDLNNFPASTVLRPNLEAQGGYGSIAFIPRNSEKKAHQLLGGSSKGYLRLWTIMSDARNLTSAWEVMADSHASVNNGSGIVGILPITIGDNSFDGTTAVLSANGILSIWNIYKLVHTAFSTRPSPSMIHRLNLVDELSRFRSMTTSVFFTNLISHPRNGTTFIITTNNGEIINFDVRNMQIATQNENDYASEPPLRQVTVVSGDGGVMRSSSMSRHDVALAQCSIAFYPKEMGFVWHNKFNRLLILSMNIPPQPSTCISRYLRTLKSQVALPGSIESAIFDSMEIITTHELGDYIVGKKIAQFYPNRGQEIELHIFDKVSGKLKLLQSCEIESIIGRKVTLCEPFRGNDIINGSTRIYLRTNVALASSIPIGSSSSSNNSSNSNGNPNKIARTVPNSTSNPYVATSISLGKKLPQSQSSSTPSAAVSSTSSSTSSNLITVENNATLIPCDASLKNRRLGIAFVAHEMSLANCHGNVTTICTHPNLPMLLLGMESDEIRVLS